jgi:hypothetical protein
MRFISHRLEREDRRSPSSNPTNRDHTNHEDYSSLNSLASERDDASECRDEAMFLDGTDNRYPLACGAKVRTYQAGAGH